MCIVETKLLEERREEVVHVVGELQERAQESVSARRQPRQPPALRNRPWTDVNEREWASRDANELLGWKGGGRRRRRRKVQTNGQDRQTGRQADRQAGTHTRAQAWPHLLCLNDSVENQLYTRPAAQAVTHTCARACAHVSVNMGGINPRSFLLATTTTFHNLLNSLHPAATP